MMRLLAAWEGAARENPSPLPHRPFPQRGVGHPRTSGTGGRPRAHESRELLDAIFYVVRGGCVWRPLTHEFSPLQTAYHYYFREWCINGTWVQVHASLRARRVRFCARIGAPRRVRPSATASR